VAVGEKVEFVGRFVRYPSWLPLMKRATTIAHRGGRNPQALAGAEFAAHAAKSMERAMLSRHLIGLSAVALVGAGSMFATAAPLTAIPAAQQTTPYVQRVDCAVGAHIGPLGACVLGTDDTPAPAPPTIVEHRAADVPAAPDGCQTKSVTHTDGMGDSETKTKTNC
jgi:hypothetical protein